MLICDQQFPVAETGSKRIDRTKRPGRAAIKSAKSLSDSNSGWTRKPAAAISGINRPVWCPCFPSVKTRLTSAGYSTTESEDRAVDVLSDVTAPVECYFNGPFCSFAGFENVRRFQVRKSSHSNESAPSIAAKAAA
jgi:hypothetical protein